MHEQADGDLISIKDVHSVLHNHMFDNAHRPTIYAELKRISKELDGLSVAIPNKVGHWIDTDEGFSPCECSECGKVEFKKSDYCPNCGAKMVEPQESEEV